MPDDPKIPFVFVPEGAPVPDAVRGPEWLSIPATLVPRADGRAAPAGQPWPEERSGRDWPNGELQQVGPMPGERMADADPVAAFRAADTAFRDPARAAGLTRLAASGGRGGRGGSSESGPTGPVAPAVPDKQWLVPRRSGKQPVYDIYVGGFGDETYGQVVLQYAKQEADKRGDNVVYFTHDVDLTALWRYIDTLPPDARINLIGHSWGADTAAKATVAATKGVDVLVTADPVSIGRPDFAGVEAHVGKWINVNAGERAAPSMGNFLSRAGSSWEDAPRGIANVFITASARHEQFRELMNARGPDGRSAREALGTGAGQ